MLSFCCFICSVLHLLITRIVFKGSLSIVNSQADIWRRAKLVNHCDIRKQSLNAVFVHPHVSNSREAAKYRDSLVTCNQVPKLTTGFLIARTFPTNVILVS